MHYEVKLILNAIKKNPPIWPLIGLSGLAVVGAAAYFTRLAFCTPDGVGFLNREKDFFQTYENRKYKFISHIDYENYKHPRPRYEE